MRHIVVARMSYYLVPRPKGVRYAPSTRAVSSSYIVRLEPPSKERPTL